MIKDCMILCNSDKYFVTSMKYCKKCILNEHMPFISFDENGVCNYCKEQEIIESNKDFNLHLKGKDFKQLLNEHKGKGRYDCIVAVSGGKDSIGALYVAKKIYKLNPLAITFSNGFLTNDMIENVQNAAAILEVDWRLYHYGKIKKGFEYFLKSPYRKQISVCDACQLFISPIKIAYNIAKAENIDIILTGSTMAQRIGAMPKTECIPAHYKYSERYRTVMKDLKNYLAKHKELEGILPDEMDLSSVTITSPWHYLDQEEIGINDILKSLNWKKIKRSYPKNSTNCKLAFLTGYLGRKYGVANYDITLSRLIRFNKLSRKDAIRKIDGGASKSEINKILAEVNLDTDKL